MIDHAGIRMGQGRDIACERIAGVNDNIHKSHYHSYFELYYLESGERNFIIENNLYATKSGDIVIFPPYVMHHAYSDKDIGFKRVLLCFQESMIESDELIRALTDGIKVYHLEKKDEYLVRDLMKIIIEEQDETGVIDQQYLKTALNTILFTLIRKSSMREAVIPDQNNVVTDVINYITYHYREPLSLQELSDYFYISPSYLCKIFKKYTNSTVVQYINNTRVLNAQRQIMESNRSITEISIENGFTNVTHFNRTFKSITGTTPLAYRKAVQAEAALQK